VGAFRPTYRFTVAPEQCDELGHLNVQHYIQFMYLGGMELTAAIGLSRDMLIQAMGMLFTASTLALAAALQGSAFLTLELGALSAAALLPALAGMALGQRLRKRLPEQLFRRVFFAALLILGAYIIASAAGGFI